MEALNNPYLFDPGALPRTPKSSPESIETAVVLDKSGLVVGFDELIGEAMGLDSMGLPDEAAELRARAGLRPDSNIGDGK